MSTPCRRDEDFGSVWGSGGKTARMKSAQQCSDMGYYSHSNVDCGGWHFKANCWEGIPGDWSRPHSDEAARERGHANRNEAGKAHCREKGYLGIDPNQWRDRGNWMYSVKCVNPDWHGDWSDEGCKDDGTQQYARHVNANGMSWEESADWLINRLPTNVMGKTIVRKTREHRGGAGMYVVVRVNNDDCKGGWKGDWNNDGCQPDGTQRFARQVDAKSRSWEDAASHVLSTIGDTFNGMAISAKTSENKGAAGMWAVVNVNDNRCFGEFLDTDWKNEGCQPDFTNKYSRKVQAHKRDWNEAADYVNAKVIGDNLNGQTIAKKAKDVNPSGAWSWIFVEDPSCKPEYKGNDWNDDGCQLNGNRRFARQVDDKGMKNWERAAEMLIGSDVTPKVGDTFKEGKVVSVKPQNLAAAGMWVVVEIENNSCPYVLTADGKVEAKPVKATTPTASAPAPKTKTSSSTPTSKSAPTPTTSTPTSTTSPTPTPTTSTPTSTTSPTPTSTTSAPTTTSSPKSSTGASTPTSSPYFSQTFVIWFIVVLVMLILSSISLVVKFS